MINPGPRARTLDGALDSLARMLAALGCPRPAWLAQAAAAWAARPARWSPAGT
jgi:hypothetical protein